VRREHVEVAPGRHLSALVWGDASPEVVLIHGGAQNAHTWDTVALALDRPLVAIDLAGHGHSDPVPSGSALDLASNARDVATVVRELAPDARGVAGMSLGGLTTLALYSHAPELVHRIVLVDITPGVTGEKSKAISAFVNGPTGFDSFDDILARTIEHNPTRTESSLRRGVLHNAVQLDDGTWVWRHARGHALERPEDAAPFQEFASMWDVVSDVKVPLMLARGMREQSVVDDDDEAELLRRCPDARVEHFEEAGHSIQGDMPVEFARVLADFVVG
jgi:pimeloyl-ACP methyl ester carboxylesterase